MAKTYFCWVGRAQSDMCSCGRHGPVKRAASKCPVTNKLYRECECIRCAPWKLRERNAFIRKEMRKRQGTPVAHPKQGFSKRAGRSDVGDMETFEAKPSTVDPPAQLACKCGRVGEVAPSGHVVCAWCHGTYAWRQDVERIKARGWK